MYTYKRFYRAIFLSFCNFTVSVVGFSRNVLCGRAAYLWWRAANERRSGAVRSQCTRLPRSLGSLSVTGVTQRHSGHWGHSASLGSLASLGVTWGYRGVTGVTWTAAVTTTMAKCSYKRPPTVQWFYTLFDTARGSSQITRALRSLAAQFSRPGSL